MLDTLNRPLRNLRLSVTDRCNLRCAYCMPEDDYVWLPREDMLHFEEISALVDVFAALGVDRVRLTGGLKAACICVRVCISSLAHSCAGVGGVPDATTRAAGPLIHVANSYTLEAGRRAKYRQRRKASSAATIPA